MGINRFCSVRSPRSQFTYKDEPDGLSGGFEFIFYWDRMMTSLHGNIFSVTGPVIDGLSLAITHRADIAGIGHQSLNDATALLVDPQRALWALGVANTPYSRHHRGTCQISWLHHSQHRSPGDFHVDAKPFTFHTSPPRLRAWRYTPPVCLR